MKHVLHVVSLVVTVLFGAGVVMQPLAVSAAVAKQPVQTVVPKKTAVKQVIPKKPVKKVAKKVVAKKPVVKKVVTPRVGEVAPLDPKNPAAQSKCMTPKIISLHTAANAQMEKDVTAKGAGFPAAVADYRQALALTWDAMKEPYCGTGTRGVSAVISSFQKTISRTRADFLRKTKGVPMAATSTALSTTSTTPFTSAATSTQR